MDEDQQKLMQDLRALVAREGMVKPNDLKPETRLDSLSIASADFIMILMAIEEEYDVYVSVDTEVAEAETVRDLLSMLMDKINEGKSGEKQS
jgi:acyl carrier protein